MLILCCKTFLRNYLVNSSWHIFHRLLQFVLAEVGSNLTQHHLQILQSSWVNLTHSSLHFLTDKINDVEVISDSIAISKHYFISFLGTWLSCGYDELMQGCAETQSYHPQTVSLQMEAGKHPADRCTPLYWRLSWETNINCPLLKMKCILKTWRRLDAWQSASHKPPCAFRTFAITHEPMTRAPVAQWVVEYKLLWHTLYPGTDRFGLQDPTRTC